VGFSPAQLRHALNLVEAVLVCTARHKTLAALTRWLRVPHADEYALADFLRVSPWDADTVWAAVRLFVLQTLGTIQATTGWRLLFVSVDDALCCKDVATRKLQAVRFHFDHVRQRRQKDRYTNASRYVTVHVQLGPVQFLVNWRLYLKQSQVQTLNRQRRAQGLAPLAYHSLPTLVQQMLADMVPQLPSRCRVYVLFDSWYASHQLFKFIRAQGWHWICAAKANHSLDARPLAQWWAHLGHQPLERITIRSTKGSRTYTTRHRVGRLRRYPDPVTAVFSKRHRRDSHPAYFLGSDTSLSVRCLLKYYSYRWQTEIDNFFLKERFGLADYRVQSIEAIQRWHTLVFAAYAFALYQRAVPLLHDPKATLAPLGTVLVDHQRWHGQQMVLHIAQLVRQGLSDADLLAELAT
jgi:hypothetical protein